MGNVNGVWARAGSGLRCCAFAVVVLLYLLSGSSIGAQQFRAAWADVFHVGMQNSGQVDTMVSNLARGHYNAVIVQVLAYMDTATASHGAYWKSSILPRSTYVTSTFDPLAYLCQQAHANGIQVHAWLGGSAGAMYRISTAWPPAGNATDARRMISARPRHGQGSVAGPCVIYYFLGPSVR